MEKEYVLEKIRELMSDDSKRPMGVDFVKLKNAVQEDLRKLLNKLLEDGEINYFKTLNGVTIYLKDSKQQKYGIHKTQLAELEEFQGSEKR